MNIAKEFIVETWQSAFEWTSENPRATAALVSCATIWTISQAISIHKQYSHDEKDETTNMDNVRCRRLLVSKLTLDCPNNIEMKEEYVEMVDGHILFTRCYIPKGLTSMKGMLCYNHGWSDHLDCLVHEICVEWAKRGYIVFSHEHFGHGRSEGLRVYCNDFDIYARHASYLHKRAKIKYSKLYNIPKNGYFLCGESFGGAVCIRQSIYEKEMNIYKPNNNSDNYNNNNNETYDWNGMVLVAPMCYIGPDLLPPQWVQNIFRYLIVPFVPTMPRAPSKDRSLLGLSEHAPQRVKKKFLEKQSNPLRNHTQQTRFASARTLIDSTYYTMKNADKVTMPLIVLHSRDDQVTAPKGSELFVKNAGSKDKELKLYDKAWHMIWHDCVKEEVYKDVEEWLTRRMQT